LDNIVLAIEEFSKFPDFIRFLSLTLFVTVLSYNCSISDPSFVSGNFKPEAGAFVFGFFILGKLSGFSRRDLVDALGAGAGGPLHIKPRFPTGRNQLVAFAFLSHDVPARALLIPHRHR
jgi:hypothetical protein